MRMICIGCVMEMECNITNGKQFKGQFDDGEKIEVGEMTWPNGDRFICYDRIFYGPSRVRLD